MLYNTFISL